MKYARRVYRAVEPALPQPAARMASSAKQRRAELRQRRRRVKAEADFRRYLVERAGNFVDALDPGPPWTRELVLQTAVQSVDRVPVLLDPDRFFASGYKMMLSYLQVAEAHGFNIRTARAVFELGCGSARLIRHLRALSGVRLVGSDINAESTAWCRKNLPGIEFYENGLEPPLAFAADDTFDLVIASSVFTHIPLDAQGPWLDEVRRVLRPGGYFLCTVEGRVKQREMLTGEQMRELEAAGELCLDSTVENVSVSTRVTGTWDVFQARSEILSVFSQRFPVLDYLPGNQDLVVVRKPARETDALSGPGDVAGLRAARASWRS